MKLIPRANRDVKESIAYIDSPNDGSVESLYTRLRGSLNAIQGDDGAPCGPQEQWFCGDKKDGGGSCVEEVRADHSNGRAAFLSQYHRATKADGRAPDPELDLHFLVESSRYFDIGSRAEREVISRPN